MSNAIHLEKTDPLFRFAHAYAAFEIRVQKAVNSVCSPFCGTCETVCCSPDYCREAAESPWLARVSGMAAKASETWLGKGGCRLPFGRPPVCYEFFCAEILRVVGPERGFGLSALGRLVHAAGIKALAGRHIVELSGEELARVNPERVEQNLRRVEALFGRAVAIAETGLVSRSDISALGCIVSPPKGLVV